MGMPNVGKSTLINFLSMKKKVTVGNKPGITKQQQWIGVGDDLEMLDTPGILVPKINDYEQGYRLVLCSLIKDDVVHLDDIAVYLLKHLYETKNSYFFERYNIDTSVEYDLEVDVEELYIQVAKSIGALLRGNEYDYTRVTHVLINDFRKQKFGKIILDHEELTK